MVACAYGLRDHHAAAGGKPHDERTDQIGRVRRIRYGNQAHVAHHLAYHHHVDRLVHVLQHVERHERQRERRRSRLSQLPTAKDKTEEGRVMVHLSVLGMRNTKCRISPAAPALVLEGGR